MQYTTRIRSIITRVRWMPLFGLALLFLSLTGSTCDTEERDLEIVITVDLTAPFHASGEQNIYSAEATVDVSDSLDLEGIMDDNDIEEIKQITVEGVFYRVLEPDPTPDRVVSASVFTVREPAGPEEDLFEINSAEVNDPELADWQVAPLTAGGVAVLNSALEKVRQFQPATLTFSVTGTSTPVSVPTDFWWEARVRLQVVGVRTIEVIDPI
jgi:hypothetical protein